MSRRLSSKHLPAMIVSMVLWLDELKAAVTRILTAFQKPPFLEEFAKPDIDASAAKGRFVPLIRPSWLFRSN